MRPLQCVFLTFFVAITLLSCQDAEIPDEGGDLYTITVTPSSGGTATADPVQARSGETITLTATPPEGCVFKSWTVVSGDVELSSTTANPATFVMSAGEVEIRADFQSKVEIGPTLISPAENELIDPLFSHFKWESMTQSTLYYALQLSFDEGQTWQRYGGGYRLSQLDILDQLRWEEGQDIFSQYLPYAIAFGCAERWAGIFAELAARGAPVPEPAWYGGYYMHNYLMWSAIGHSMDGIGQSFQDSIQANAAAQAEGSYGSGGGSGFSGGGFGGGVGGGGGGSW